MASSTLFTWRSLPAEQMTKWSVITRVVLTSSTTMSAACLSAAARAAVMATSLLAGRAHERSAPDDDRHVGDTRWYLGHADRPDPEGVADGLGLGLVVHAVRHDLGALHVERLGVAAQDHAVARSGTIASPTAPPAPGTPLPLRTSTGTGASVPKAARHVLVEPRLGGHQERPGDELGRDDRGVRAARAEQHGRGGLGVGRLGRERDPVGAREERREDGVPAAGPGPRSPPRAGRRPVPVSAPPRPARWPRRRASSAVGQVHGERHARRARRPGRPGRCAPPPAPTRPSRSTDPCASPRSGSERRLADLELAGPGHDHRERRREHERRPAPGHRRRRSSRPPARRRPSRRTRAAWALPGPPPRPGCG